MKRIIFLAAAIAATTAAPLASATLAADGPIARVTAAANSGSNAEFKINVTGDRRPCRGWYFQWKVQGNTSAGRLWMRHCR